MKKALSTLLLVVLPLFLNAGPVMLPDDGRERIKLDDIPKSVGSFCITDGFSIYIFRRDGSFLSEPIQKTWGRKIEGTWSRDMNMFEIKGIRSWINGLSSPHKIEMEIYVGTVWNDANDHKSPVTGEEYTVYDAYFTINSLTLPKPK